MGKATAIRRSGKGAEPRAQAQLLTFLRNPRSFPGKVHRVRLLQTHASWIALTERHAFKVKKPVDFGFLDFATLAKRRYFCEREVELNRRLCPGVHLGIVPISMRGARLEFGSQGRIVEYAVKMRRLPARQCLLQRLARGEITRNDVKAIVATLAPFYQNQTPTAEVTEWGRSDKLRVSTDENFRQTRDFIGREISRPAFEAIRTFTNAFFRLHRSLLRVRVREKHIRDCHGDLHLEHIYFTRSGLVIYDCIEFNDRLRYLDVASDAAFLAMDFDFHDRADLGRYFASRLAAKLGDPHLLRLLDFYKCYRAYVRGKVESYHSLSTSAPESERRECRLRAGKYFRLSLGYAVSGSRPMVLVVMGRVASGKSTLASGLGRELGWEVFSSDQVRKKLAGVALHRRGGPRQRQRLYAASMSDKTYAALASYAVRYVREGRSVVLDATFGERHRRDAVRQALTQAGIDYCFVDAQAGTATLRRRLAERAHAEREISDARVEDFSKIDQRYQPPAEVGAKHCFAVKTMGGLEHGVSAVLKTLAQRCALGESHLL